LTIKDIHVVHSKALKITQIGKRKPSGNTYIQYHLFQIEQIPSFVIVRCKRSLLSISIQAEILCQKEKESFFEKKFLNSSDPR
jgi:hypothetical protein